MRSFLSLASVATQYPQSGAVKRGAARRFGRACRGHQTEVSDAIRIGEPQQYHSLADLLGMPVRLDAVTLGFVSDVICNPPLGHVLGVLVEEPLGRERFAPWIALSVRSGEVRVLDVASLGSSESARRARARGRSVRALLQGEDREDGRVRELTATDHGDIGSIVVATGVRRPRRRRVVASVTGA